MLGCQVRDDLNNVAACGSNGQRKRRPQKRVDVWVVRLGVLVVALETFCVKRDQSRQHGRECDDCCTCGQHVDKDAVVTVLAPRNRKQGPQQLRVDASVCQYFKEVYLSAAFVANYIAQRVCASPVVNARVVPENSATTGLRKDVVVVLPSKRSRVTGLYSKQGRVIVTIPTAILHVCFVVRVQRVHAELRQLAHRPPVELAVITLTTAGAT